MKREIEIRNASVKYYMRKTGRRGPNTTEESAVGAKISIGAHYLEVEALRNISLSLKEGDRVGLIGRNGSGKSTLLKLCAGALAPHTGSIHIQGKVTPQLALGAGLQKELSGRKNAELKCLYMGTPQRQIATRIEEVKALSELGMYFELPIRSYSAGMRSRLVMSLMHIMRAEILLMDEWINVADASIGSTANRLQAELIEESRILMIASHSRRILEEWTDSLVCMHKGEIVEHGPVSEVYEKYSRQVAST